MTTSQSRLVLVKSLPAFARFCDATSLQRTSPEDPRGDIVIDPTAHSVVCRRTIR
jgi:hypothetical protein